MKIFKFGVFPVDPKGRVVALVRKVRIKTSEFTKVCALRGVTSKHTRPNSKGAIVVFVHGEHG